MPKEFNPQRLDVREFAEAGGQLSGSTNVGRLQRLADETQGRGIDQPVVWRAEGELRNRGHVHPQVWLHLHAQAPLPLICQRCLGPVETPVAFDRWFRFVADEVTAEGEDDESEEDVLTLSRQFDLLGLIEDEILMEMPLVPRHESCPIPVTLQIGEHDIVPEEPAPHPFAALGKLRNNTKD